MKTKVFLFFALFLFFGFTNAQTKCSCNETLQKIISKIESEYPGFDIKTKDKLLYNSVKENAIKASAEAKSDDNCLEILKSYTGFFKDRHIWVLPNGNSTPQIANNVSSKNVSKPLNINLGKFKKEVQTQKNSFEGIWKDDSYEIGIKKLNEKESVGFIIKANPKFWKPNEVKLRLFSDGTYEYYMQDHSSQKGTYKMIDNSLLYFDDIKSAFTKSFPQSNLNENEIEDKINEINGFYIKKLTPKTTIIKMQYFSYMFVNTIEKLIEKNKTLLENSEFLIIDVRDNGGGTDNAYQKILPYLVTNSVRNVGAEYLASPTLIKTMENYLLGVKKDSIKNKDEISDINSRLKLLKANLGKYVNYNQNKVNISSVSPAVKSPSQIVVLANNHTGSAAENFLLNAKQSKKVKLMGIPSSGVLDYANAMFFEYGCDNYKLLMPTYKSFRLPDYPIDNIGVQPDIYLDESVENWEKFAVDYLEN
ncbi:S41 family peptidase [Epilithonimonas xixisoli]|uniref:Peptidase S41-like protein n=1 Tax=Epilithonimonas xixisoli TaxID=1476462 RepID=A0A4V3H2H9_9FLAO|nr:S41 family peptidase [Epilithonimonas xixisoli]TDX84066.1 peptidase S41-like protein [Epilithonimonas xixisoli]